MTWTPEPGHGTGDAALAGASAGLPARWVEQVHEVVVETGDTRADAAVDAAVDWIAAVLVATGDTTDPPPPSPPPASGPSATRAGSAASCTSAAARLQALAAEVGARSPDPPDWTHGALELSRRLQEHATLLAGGDSSHRHDTPAGRPGSARHAHALSLSAARVRRAALACRSVRGGPALPFRP